MTIQERYEQLLNVPSDIQEHLPTLCRYGLLCHVIVEFGVRTGLSTIALLSSRPIEMKSYDVEITPEAESVAILAKGDGINFELCKADVLSISIKECDLLFIDTWHVEEQLEKELLLHARNVRRFIVLHDTTTFGLIGEDPERRGLMFALIPFLENNRDCWRVREHFTGNNGLTVLERIYA
ncbi:MAG: hypothetical protein ABFD91_04065 [Anaerohalosphaeraceae bacterium]